MFNGQVRFPVLSNFVVVSWRGAVNLAGIGKLFFCFELLQGDGLKVVK